MNRFDHKKMIVVDMGTGSFAREQGEHERFNLDRNRVDGKYYGYCPPKDDIDICTHFGASSRDDYVENILVVYVAKKKDSTDREIIAFCPKAKIYGKPQSGEGLNREFTYKKDGKEITASYTIVSDELIKINKARKTIINNDTSSTFINNTDPETKNRFRHQRFYGSKYPNLANEIVAYIEEILEEKKLFDNDFNEQEEIQLSEPATPKEIEGSADRPLDIVFDDYGEIIKKNIRFSKLALIQANFTCQINPGHKTFTTRHGVPYMEGHHLIPCTVSNAEYFYKKDRKNIDCVENITCICPNCHRAVHFGDTPTKSAIIKELFSKQNKTLKRVGIIITEEELLKRYKVFD